MKRLLCTLLGALIVPTAAWLHGYNFDHRGPEASFLFVTGVFVGLFVWGFSGWYDND